jgi:putative DNA primase/helicase
MIDGLHDWMERGLSPPEAVTEATKAYLDAEDATGAWLEECCEKSPDAWDATKRLFSSWKDWSERAGEFTGSARQMGDRLEARGYIRHRRNRARGHSGLQRIPDSVPDHPHWNPE